MNLEIKILYELLQNTSFILKNLVNSEIAMNDGEIADCQKFNKESQTLLSASIKDTFEEFVEMAGTETDEVNDYDIPNNFELIRQLNQVQCDLAITFDLINDNLSDEIIKSNLKKIVVNLNTIKEIYEAIYLN